MIWCKLYEGNLHKKGYYEKAPTLPFLFKMPQLLPFFFVNQLSFSFITLMLIVVIFSKYVLPMFTFGQVVRLYITKLSV